MCQERKGGWLLGRAGDWVGESRCEGCSDYGWRWMEKANVCAYLRGRGIGAELPRCDPWSLGLGIRRER